MFERYGDLSLEKRISRFIREIILLSARISKFGSISSMGEAKSRTEVLEGG